MRILHRGQYWLHLCWGTPALIVAIVTSLWYLSECHEAGEWLRGGSRPGLICGIIAGGIILFEMLLWPKKAWRASRIFILPAKHYMSAHIWFGLACAPLAILHCGFHLGGWLPTSLLLLMLATVASGVYGLALQNSMPSRMLRELPSETIYTEIPNVSRENIELFRQQLDRRFDESNSIDEDTERNHYLRVLEKIKPYLEVGSKSRIAFHEVQNECANLQASASGKNYDLVDELRRICEDRRQFDLQIKYQRRLHGWLPIHVAMSVLLTGMLAIHVYFATKYR